MSVFLMAAERPQVPGRSADVALKAVAYDTFIAYGGTYELQGDAVVHHVEFSSVPVWTGGDPGDPTAWAWEGQGATEEEARHAAQRLRQLYVSLLPELRVERGHALDQERFDAIVEWIAGRMTG